MKNTKSLSSKYWLIPVLLMIILNFIAYNVTKFIADGWEHYDFHLPIDNAIPFLPAFITVYILAYIQWVVGYGLIAIESKEVCYRVISSEMISKLICLVIFLVLPTSMNRPEITGTDMFSKLTQFIYNADTPTNLFPSVHCLESWILFRTTSKVTAHKKWLLPLWGISALLVFASVVFVKQHLILDIPAAIIVGEIGLFLGKKLKTERIFEKINDRFLKGA